MGAGGAAARAGGEVGDEPHRTQLRRPAGRAAAGRTAAAHGGERRPDRGSPACCGPPRNASGSNRRPARTRRRPAWSYSGPDEDVAAELDRSAARALARGGRGTAGIATSTPWRWPWSSAGRAASWTWWSRRRARHRPSPGRPTSSTVLVRLATEGHRTAARPARETVAASPLWTERPAPAGMLAVELWDIDAHGVITAWVPATARETGSPLMLRLGPGMEAASAVHAGDFTAATSAIAEDAALLERDRPHRSGVRRPAARDRGRRPRT